MKREVYLRMENLFENELPRRDFIKMSAIAAGSTALAMSGLANAKNTPMPKGHPTVQGHKDLAGGMALLKQEVVDTLVAKDFNNLIGKVQGLSDNQLRAHFKLYENYINKLNLIHQLIAKADQEMLSGANPSYAPFRELHAEQSFAHNSVVLHELYFGNLGYTQGPSKELLAMINANFGSWENYIKHFMAVGKAMRGWAVTGLDLRDGHIRNFGLDSHNTLSPVHFYPILVLDVYEHAYMIDYATDRAKYLDTFVNNINWNAVNDRLLFAVHHLMAGPAATA